MRSACFRELDGSHTAKHSRQVTTERFESTNFRTELYCGHTLADTLATTLRIVGDPSTAVFFLQTTRSSDLTVSTPPINLYTKEREFTQSILQPEMAFGAYQECSPPTEPSSLTASS